MNFFTRKRDHSDLARTLVIKLRKSKIPSFRQLRYLKKVLTPIELRILRILGIIVLLNLVYLNVAAYRNATILAPAAGGTYREAIVGFPRTINPVFTNHAPDLDLISLVFSGLFRYDPERRDIVPDLVSDYRISADEKVYTLTLREGVIWHDKEPLTADDVIFTIESIQDPEYQSPLYPALKDVTVKKIDDHTLELTLPEPYAPFLGTLTFGIIPEHIWKDVPPSTAHLAEYNTHPVGTGPFLVRRVLKDKQGIIRTIELDRNAEYFAGAPYLKSVIFKFYGETTEALAALRQKEVDGFGMLPAPDQKFEDIQSTQWNTLKPTFAQYTALFFNSKKNDLLKEKDIRQALLLALPKKDIAKKFFDDNVLLLKDPILPGITEEEDQAQANPEEAKAVIEKFRQKQPAAPAPASPAGGSSALHLAITFPNTPEYSDVAQEIQTAWNALGIEVTLNPIDSGKIRRDIIKPREYEILLTSVKLGADADPFPFWHGSQRESPGLNLTFFSNRDADKLLEEARTIRNPETRTAKYLEFEKILASEVPAIFLWAPLYAYRVDTEVKGISLKHLSDAPDRFADISHWYMKQKRVWR